MIPENHWRMQQRSLHGKKRSNVKNDANYCVSSHKNKESIPAVNRQPLQIKIQ